MDQFFLEGKQTGCVKKRTQAGETKAVKKFAASFIFNGNFPAAPEEQIFHGSLPLDELLCKRKRNGLIAAVWILRDMKDCDPHPMNATRLVPNAGMVRIMMKTGMTPLLIAAGRRLDSSLIPSRSGHGPCI